MLRILTVTLNPALDQVYEVADFAVGKLNRPTSKTVTAGGKGINVARAYRALGGNAMATGLAGGSVGRDIVNAATNEGIPTAFVSIAAESRACVKVADSVTGVLTELNEPGPAVTAEEYGSLLARVRELLPDFDVIVLSGSVPPGVPIDVYAQLIRMAQENFGVAALLDASGAALKAGIEAMPQIVKPNRHEAAEIGIDPDRWPDAATELRSQYRIPVAVVTAGAEGAAVDSNAGKWQAVSPPIDVKSAVGSGDSLTAGFLSGWGDRDAMAALRFGVAAGAVNAQSYRSGDVTADAVREMADRVIVTEM